MTEITTFTFDRSPVRTLTIDGEPWFVLNDLCSVLGISNPHNVATRLDPECLQKAEVLDGRGIMRETNIVDESGIYEVALRANGESARPFRRWVTSEVLPSIRKTGGYGSVAPSGPELLALAVVEAQQMIAAKDHQIAILEPKASAWDDLVSSTGSVSFRDAAKIISEDGGVTIGGVHLIDKLMEWGWVFRPALTTDEKRRGKKNRSIRAYQTQINAGTLTEKAKHYTDQETGEQKLSNNPQTRVTGKGLDRIRTRLINEKAAA